MEKRIAIIGATGVAGQVLLELLAQRFDAIPELFGSTRSAGKLIPFRDTQIAIQLFTPEKIRNFDAVFLLTSDIFSREHSEKLAQQNRWVIDTSAAFRYSQNIPLVIADINGKILQQHSSNLISSPNCSTILALSGLYPLHRKKILKHAFIATYQSVSGNGRKGLQALEWELQHPQQKAENSPYSYPIAHNIISQIGDIEGNGFSEEENAIFRESQRILSSIGDSTEFEISATCVRVPVFYGHSMAIHATFENDISVSEARDIIQTAPMLKEAEKLITPREIRGKPYYFIQRIRQDFESNRLAFFLLSDQVLCGATLNAVKILDLCFQKP